MGGTFVESHLQGIVTAVADALVKPLLQHIWVRPPGLNSARSRLGGVHGRAPVQMSSDGDDQMGAKGDKGEDASKETDESPDATHNEKPGMNDLEDND